jgi:hypothetical protein
MQMTESGRREHVSTSAHTAAAASMRDTQTQGTQHGGT